MASIDLNADLGEGCGSDVELLALVTSASISCGAHAGDERTIRAAIDGALERGVAIGAHPGYADRDGFGRRETGATPGDIRDSMLTQLEAFAAACASARATFSHVKPHGALYNRAMHDASAAHAVARAVRDFDSALAILGMPDSRLLEAAESLGLRAVREAFLDRGYATPDALLARGEPGALITDPEIAAARAERIVLANALICADGSERRIDADTLCVHGDSPHAVALLRAARTRLERAGVRIAPFGVT